MPRKKGNGHAVKNTKKRKSEDDDDDDKNKTTIKLRLASVIKNVDSNGEPLPKQELIHAIEQMAEYASKISQYGGEFLLRCLIEHCTNPNSLELYGDIGALLNKQSFFAQCLRRHPGIRERGGIENTYDLVRVIRDRYYQDDAPFEYLDWTGVTPDIVQNKAREHQTNCLNLYKYEFYTYMRECIKAFLRWLRNGEAKKALVDKILWKILGKDITLEGDDNSLAIQKHIDDHRRALKLPTLEQERQGEVVMPDGFIDQRSALKDDNRKWIKKNLGRVVLYFYFMSRYLEGNPFGKNILLSPIYKTAVGHIQIDSTTLHVILRAVGYISMNRTAFLRVSESYWKELFNYEKYEVDNDRQLKVYGFSFKSDGYAASLVYNVQKKVDGDGSGVPTDIDDLRLWINDPNSGASSEYFRFVQ